MCDVCMSERKFVCRNFDEHEGGVVLPFIFCVASARKVTPVACRAQRTLSKVWLTAPGRKAERAHVVGVKFACQSSSRGVVAWANNCIAYPKRWASFEPGRSQ